MFGIPMENQEKKDLPHLLSRGRLLVKKRETKRDERDYDRQQGENKYTVRVGRCPEEPRHSTKDVGDTEKDNEQDPELIVHGVVKDSEYSVRSDIVEKDNP